MSASDASTSRAGHRGDASRHAAGRDAATAGVGLGVDLGATGCRAALARAGAVEPLASPVAGSQAAALPGGVRLAHAPRLLATAFAGADRRRLELAVHASLTADERGEVGIASEAGVVSGRALVGALLGAVRAESLAAVGGELGAVIAVPSWFSERQRSALRAAAGEAGLDVQRLVSAPAAAALAFAAGRSLARRRLLVVDLGAGGASCALVEVTGDEVSVLAQAGDELVGGLDFDLALAGVLAEGLPDFVGAALDRGEPGWAVDGLLQAAERAKRDLSTELVTSVDVPTEPPRGGRPTQARRVDVLRSRFEACTGALTERVLELVSGLLRDAAVEARSLDDVLLLGGQSAIPAVRAGLAQRLARPALVAPLLHAAVARGAALLAGGMRRGAPRRRGAQVLEVLQAPIGLAVAGGGAHRLFERWARLPTRAQARWPVGAGRRTRVALVEGATAAQGAERALGWLELVASRQGELCLELELDGDGCLALGAILPGEAPRRVELLRGEPGPASGGGSTFELPPLPALAGSAAATARARPLLERLRGLLGATRATPRSA